MDERVYELLTEYLCYGLENAIDTQTISKLNFRTMDVFNCTLFSLAFITGTIASFQITLDSFGLCSPIYIYIFPY
jgi:hypothetical protein